MNHSPIYDSNVPKIYYDSFGEKEWTRLSRDAAGELLYHVHMDVFRCYIHQPAAVLELGAGAGISSKELAMLAGQLIEFSKDPVYLKCGANRIYVVKKR